MERVWWERVPNAMAFLSDITESLLDEKSIVLSCLKEFPWYSYMVQSIKEIVLQQNSSKRFESAKDVEDPGAYLLAEFCKSEKRAEYRPAKSYARFFAESDDIVLHERYFWIKMSSKEQLNSWMKFVSEYRKERGKNKDAAVFILEWKGEGGVLPKKGIKICCFDDYVNEYDRIVFCTLAASAVKESSFIKNYLTELTANVVDNDIELCAQCIGHCRDFLEEPYGTIGKIISSEVRSDGSEFRFAKPESEVNRLIWLAQIRTIYPVLEEYRESFVQKYAAMIEKQLPISSSFGEIYDNPADVELGTLKFMADERKLNLSQKEYDRLKMNKEARNKLSHLAQLTLEEIKKLGS